MITLQKQILDAVSYGTKYLYQQQQEDGSFLSFSSSNKKDFTNALQFHSTFSTSLILDSLYLHPQTQQLRKMKLNAASFLLKQKSSYWSFNYWVRDSEHTKKLPYPDDLDDTCCALSALFHYDTKIIDGSVLAHVINLLATSEIKEGGPYRTWLVPETADKVWKDIDIAVNSNIAYFLSLYEIALPRLSDFIETGIIKNTLTSPYYPSIYPILYFISRFYKGKYKDKLVKILLAKRNNKQTWNNPLNTALAICTLINLQAPFDTFDKSVQYLLQSQIDGYWKPYPFYTGVNPKRDKTYYAGSSALTTAFCLEALNKYLQLTSSKETKKSSEAKKILLHKQIMKTVENRFLFPDNEIRKTVINTLYKMIENDKKLHISLTTYYFATALGSKKKDISKDFIITLSTANVLGWLAYTIYDDFLDEEGDPQLLSAANIALRTICSIYETILPKKSGFTEIVHKIMDKLDYANAWEIKKCRIEIINNEFNLKDFVIPDFNKYEKLEEKSLGHALGPLAILFSLGFKNNSPEVKKILLFFKHYLIARQLNDDAHDWEQDFLKGHCNSVGSLLFKKYQQRELNDNNKVVIEKYLPELQKIFWYEVITEVCSLINLHIKKARDVLHDCPIIVKPSILEQMLVPYEQSVKKALDERKNTLQFLETYTSNKY